MLTRESRDPFGPHVKGGVDKHTGKENKLRRKKTANFLATKFPDVHLLLTWAEKQAEDIIEEKLAGGCLADPKLQAAKLTVECASIISFHPWGFINNKLTEDAWDLSDIATMWAGLEVLALDHH